MKEYDLLLEKKTKAQFLTPDGIRLFISNEVGKCAKVFDCSVGSGQLLFGIDAETKTGVDIDKQSVLYAKENGIDAYCQDYITCDDSAFEYDVSVANYPFSLKATSEQKKYIEQHNFLNLFCNNKCLFSGYLDFVFILKSFIKSEKGFYLCFPGIAYRANEKKYREYLIQKGFVEKVSLLTNTGFKGTNISILYLKLTKKNNKYVVFSEIDIKTGEELQKVVKYDEIVKNDYCFSTNLYIEKLEDKEEVCIKNIESIINKCFLENLKVQIELDLFLIKNDMLEKHVFLEKIHMAKEIIENAELAFQGETPWQTLR